MDNKQNIMLYLAKNLGSEYTLHELSKNLNIPYATFYRLIQKDIEESNDFSVRKVGRSKVISLNLEKNIIINYLAIASNNERIKFLKNQSIIKKITDILIDYQGVVLLFGSYAKGKQRKDSDIDFLIINKNGKKDISFSKYEILFDIKINPIFITKEEFSLMLKEKEENVGKQALKKHILINNFYEFWKGVINGF